MLKAIIFDMDGVLVDSERIHYEADKRMLKEQFGIDMSFDYYKQYIGGTVSNMWNGIIRDFKLENVDEYILNSYTDDILKEMLEKRGYPAVAGVVPFIKKIKRETNLLLAVASSSSMSRIKDNLTSLGIMKYFDVLESGQDLGVSKPNPAVFLETAKKLGVKNEECMVIEDSENGIMAAANGKIPCLGYINPNSGNQNLSGANAVFESFENLDMNFINMIYGHSVGEAVNILETDRLKIREITIEDVPVLYSLYDEEITKYMPPLFEKMEEEIEYTKKYIDNVYGLYHYGIWIVELKESGEIIGRAGIEYKEIDTSDYTHELGYMIGKKYQNNGYAKEAVEAVLSYMREYYGIEDIFVEISENNYKSIELAKKMGFEFTEGRVNDKYLVGELKTANNQTKKM
ncbi:MAG: GNAT family N-acetyltransferase [Lachnospiraceae bacterium]|nr:GNAT family N-acetyltransferase [Lachnospiraceae bacterium]